MRLQRIYSSKLYVTSTRKDRIHAAMQDPINAELVQQLSEYLDDDSLRELKQAEKEIKNKQEAESKSEGQGQAEDSESDSFHSSGSNGSFNAPAFSGDPAADFGEDDLADVDIPDEGGESSASADVPEEPIESVTQEGRPITSATIIYWNTLDDVVSDCDTIKGTLNVREDTNGVTRLEVKDNELWIYYNDDSNLNDKMVEVIDVLNSTGYTYLKFNRLARSNNAIVFDINLNSNDMIKSTKELENEKK